MPRETPFNPSGADPTSGSEAIAVLVANHRRFLTFLERRTGSRETAEDILQDAFVRGLSRASQLRDQESVVAWFYRSLRNALADHWRRRASERRFLDELTTSADGEPALDPELMQTVCECVTSLVDTLKPEYAEVLRRVDIEGVRVRDFAQEHHLSQNNVSVRLSRARAALRRQLERCCRTCADHGCVDCRCGNMRAT